MVGMRIAMLSVQPFIELELHQQLLVLESSSCSEDVIRTGAEDEASWVQAVAAASPRITVELAEQLSKSKVVKVQEALAGNPAVPERIRVVVRMRAEGGL